MRQAGSTLRVRRLISGAVFLVAASFYGLIGAAAAQSPVERGAYLVNSILACGNCHTPKSATGEPVSAKDLAAGLSFTLPPYAGTASNITPDPDTGIGRWTDAEIRRALIEGTRPNHGRLASTPLAVMPTSFFRALLPGDLDAVVAYLRTVKPVRNEVPTPQYRMPVRHDRYPDAEAGFTEAMMPSPVKRGAYLGNFVLTFAELLSDRLDRHLVARAMTGQASDYEL